MTCNGARELIPLFVGGDLTEVRMDEVREHLAQCADCSGELKKFEECRELIAEINAPELSRSQVHQMWSAIRSEIGVAPEVKVIRFSPAALLKIAAVAIIGISVGYSTYGIVSIFKPSAPAPSMMPMADVPTDLDPNTIRKIGQDTPNPAGPRVVINTPANRNDLTIGKLQEENQELRRQIIMLQSQIEGLSKRIVELSEKNK
jgi:hypothetical protein